MYIILPCAGYGTRLKELTHGKPKPLLEINGVAILTRIINNLSGLDPKGFFVITNDKFHSQFQEWRDMEGFDHNHVKIINDGTSTNETRLGTLNDILLATDIIPGEKFLVYLGDNLLTDDLSEAAKKFSHSKNNLIILKDLNSLEDAKRFGVLEVDDNHKITGLEEKPDNPKSTLISTGIYFLQPQIASKIRDYVDSGSSAEGLGFFIRDTFKDIHYDAFILGSDVEWVDIGSMESYNRAREIFR